MKTRSSPPRVPLSPTQEGILFHTLYEQNSGVYVQQLIGDLHESLHVPHFKEAWHHIIQRHEIFRTRFTWRQGGEAFQTVHPSASLPLEVYDCRPYSPGDRQQYIDQYLKQDRKKGFDLQQPPLMRVAIFHFGDTHHQFIWTSHHLLLDGRARFLVLKELFAYYEALCQSASISFSSPPQFQQFIYWLTQKTFTQREQYWRTRLKGLQGATPLPFFDTSSSPSDNTLTSQTHSVALSENITKTLQQLATKHGLTLNTMLQGAWSLYLTSLTGQSSALFGVTRSSRHHTIRDADNIIGLCITTLPFRIEISTHEQVLPWLKKIRMHWKELQTQEHTPLSLIQSWSDVPSSEPLFESLLLFDHAPLNTTLQSLGDGWHHRHFSLQEQTHYPVTIHGYGGNQLLIEISYNPARLTQTMAQNILEHLKTAMTSMAEHPMQTLRDVSFLPKSERHQLLVEWMATTRPYSSSPSLQQLFEQQVVRTPDTVALIFEDQHWTYERLNARANQLAHYLRRRQIGPDHRVGVLMERSGNLLPTLLAILKSGAAYVPLDPSYPLSRIATMLTDCSPSLLLTDQRDFSHKLTHPLPITYLDTEGHQFASESTTNLQNFCHPDNLAYIIFTSGSTGFPKGVMNTHRGIINRLSWMQEAFNLDDSERILQKTPFSFDVSVWELFCPLLQGGTVVMAKPEGHRDGSYLTHLITTQRITTVHFVPSQLQDMVQQPPLKSCLSLKKVICSGESLPVSLQTDFFSISAAELHNLYGPTEAAIDVTAWFCRRNERNPTVPIGYPIANTKTFVVNPWCDILPIGIPGQLLLGGPQLARGYWNRPGLTAKTFIPHPFSTTPGHRLYATGDLVRYDQKGALEFIGRIDHQIQLRGHRIELGEIESVLRKNPLIQNAIVLCEKTINGESQLFACIIPTHSSCSIEILRKTLHNELPRYMVPTHFILMSSFPLTSNGKVDRKRLTKHTSQKFPQEIPYIPPNTPIQTAMAEIWETVLGRTKIGMHENFFDIGGHSLLATRVISRIREKFGVDLPIRQLYENPTIQEFHEILGKTNTKTGTRITFPIQPCSREDPLSLSFAQQRLWFLHQMEPNSIAYNMSWPLRLSGALEIPALKKSLQSLIDRHESLRTTFKSTKGHAYQIIAGTLTLPWEFQDLRHVSKHRRVKIAQQRIHDRVREPFDLTRGPLIRVTLLRLGTKDFILLLTLHHIISDGWSMGVISRELAILYEGFRRHQPPSLTPLPIQYADFSEWQHAWFIGEVCQTQLSYWRKQLANLSPLELPTDRPRPPVLSSQATCISRQSAPVLVERLHSLSRQHGVTLATTLLAAFQVLLARYTGQKDIIVGTPIANRNRTEIEEVVGFFVNTLVIRTTLSGDPTFRHVLEQVHEVSLSAHDNQDLPFERLIEDLAPERELSRNPLFQVMFAFQNTPFEGFTFPGVSVSHYDPQVRTTRFDLECHLWERTSGLELALIYSTTLFDTTTIHRFLDHFFRILDSILEDPNQRLSQLPIFSNNELKRLMVDWNQTETDYPRHSTLTTLFETQVEKTPDTVALVFEERQLTYSDLNNRANQLAHYLQQHRVGPEVCVGLFLERGPEMIIGILGILKTGGIYVPLDPKAPPGRTHFILKDANVALLLTEASLKRSLPTGTANILALDTDWPLIAKAPTVHPINEQMATSRACVFYTSGSTGNPKGITLPHRAIVRLVRNTNYIEFNSSMRMAQTSTLAFDAATFEIWGALLNGARLVVIAKSIVLAPQEFRDFLQTRQITTIFLTTSLFHQFVKDNPQTLQHIPLVLFGGEAVDPQSVRITLQDISSTSLINVYGPTENTTFTTYMPIESLPPDEMTIPIGQPIANTKVYILDRHYNPVSVGIFGELFAGGDGLAHYYLNQPALTAEKFIPHPFSEEPGSRLYRTGDEVRHRPDGNLEFKGRLDFQVKIRGYRIELGEIQATLTHHPMVDDAVILVYEEDPGDKRLVAYVVPDPQHIDKLANEEGHPWIGQHIKDWQTLYEQTYGHHGDTEEGSTWDFAGWNSSYTGLPIPRTEMMEWVEATVSRIRTLRPQCVLEIGFGTGLLLHRLAPHCAQYIGTDFSPTVVQSIQKFLSTNKDLEHVRVRQQSADDCSQISPQSVDTVIINSVTQYFPSMDYLAQVLANAVVATKPGGHIFVGDVRSLPLLTAYHTSIQTQLATNTLTAERLFQQIQLAEAREEELVIDPAFFSGWAETQSRVSHVEVLLKQGQAHNELTRFRFDVILHIESTAPGHGPIIWRDWNEENLTLEIFQEWLKKEEPLSVGLCNIPNGRLQREIFTRQWLAQQDRARRTYELQEAWNAMPQDKVDPHIFYNTFAQLPYWYELGYGDDEHGDTMTAVFLRRTSEKRPCVLPSLSTPPSPGSSWRRFGTNPLKSSIMSTLIPTIRTYLKGQLPEYMLPRDYVMMSYLPLTLNGKINRQALPLPVGARSLLDTPFAPPQTITEHALANIWQELLGIEKIGRHDNFFELGCHSLLATQFVSRVLQHLNVELALREIFEAPTLALLAERMEDRPSDPQGTDQPSLRPRAKQHSLPLSFAQQRLWYLHQLAPESPAYSIHSFYRLQGPWNPVGFEWSLNEVVKRHDSLRTIFPLVNDSPIQMILPSLTIPIPVIDLSSRTPAERKAEIKRITAQETQTPFDLSTDYLIRTKIIRVAPEEHVILISLHHIISDGWSLGILHREIEVFYLNYLNRKAPNPPSLAIQYSDFTQWQRDWLSSSILERHLTYWREQLQDLPILEMPLDKTRPKVQSFNGARHVVPIHSRTAEGLQALSIQQDVTLFVTLLGAFQVLLARLTGQHDIVVGSPIANRNRREIEDLIGFFVNTLVMRTDLSGNPEFREALTRVQKVAMGAYEHQDLPFERLVEELQPERDLSRNPLFQVTFALQNAPFQPFTFPNTSVSPLSRESTTTHFDLECHIWGHSPDLTIHFVYNTDLFTQTTISRLGVCFQKLLEEIVRDPDQPIWKLPLLSQEDKHQILVKWNGTQTPYPHTHCVHELFEAQTDHSPKSPAVTFQSKTLTYGQLNGKANTLARKLQQKGIKVGDFVPVIMERSPELIISYLGVLKAGAAFVPLDPNWPESKLLDNLTHMNSDCVLMSHDTISPTSRRSLRPIIVDEPLLDEDTENVTSMVGPDDPAYVIFTSGSTGKPKGAINHHRGMVNRLWNMQERYPWSEKDTVLVTLRHTFDASLWQYFWPLLHGAREVLPSPTPFIEMQEMFRLIEQEQVTLTGFVPSIFQLVVNELEHDPSLSLCLSSLKHLLIGGEVLHADPIHRFWTLCPDVCITKTYGPTETSISTIFYDIPKDCSDPIPLGRPLKNVNALVLDSQQNLVPLGLPGELYLGGVCVGHGYLQDRQATRAAFLPNPFPELTASRLYRTGDQVCLQENGIIRFLGRLDHQIKIRGARVELEEIESRLLQHPDIDQAVVVSTTQPTGEPHLVGYIVTITGRKDFKSSDLRKYLNQYLPKFMVPQTIITLDRLPLSPNGKIKRDSLPNPNQMVKTSDQFIPPGDKVEQQLALIWSEALKIEKISCNEDFFDLGGHSLLVMQVISRMFSTFGVNPSIHAFFEAPTIAEQTSLVKELISQREQKTGSSHTLPNEKFGLGTGPKGHPQSSPILSINPIITLQPKGPMPPLFLVHALGGGIGGYRTLAKWMDNDQPIYGLQGLELIPELEETLSIESLAERYISKVHSIQSMGPYRLGGWSMGGVIAYEMARQLELLNQRVEILFLIDSFLPSQHDVQKDENAANLLNQFWKTLTQEQQGELPQEASDWKASETTQGKGLEALWRYGIDTGALPASTEPSHVRKLWTIFKRLKDAFFRYRPKPYGGNLYLVQADSHNKAKRQRAQKEWKKFTPNKVIAETISGTHYSILQVPHVHMLIQTLHGYLPTITKPTQKGRRNSNIVHHQNDQGQQGDLSIPIHRSRSNSVLPTSTDIPQGLSLESRPLISLIEKGEIPPVDSVAISYLQDYYFKETGFSKTEILGDWYHNHSTFTHIIDTSLGRVGILMLPCSALDLYTNQQDLLDLIIEAIHIASTAGARTVSLTGLLPSATDYGQALDKTIKTRPHFPAITTGHATTAATVFLNIQKILTEGSRTLEIEKVGFLGLGSIGISSLRLMLQCLPHPNEITLCDIYHQEHLLEDLKKELRVTHRFQGAIQTVISKGPVPDSFYRSTLIIGATNVANILDMNKVQKGTMIVDDSGPHCFSLNTAIARLHDTRDILFSEGGNIQGPSPMTCIRYIPWNSQETIPPQLAGIFSRFQSGRITGCVLASLLLANLPNQTPVLGQVGIEQGKDNFDLLQRLGFTGADLHCEGYELPAVFIRAFSDCFGSRAARRPPECHD